MYRFFVEESQIYDGTVHITGSDVNHIKNVLRMRPGEKILVSTGGEKEYHCAVSDFPEGEVLAAVEEVTAADRELPSGIVLFQGLPKGDKMDGTHACYISAGACNDGRIRRSPDAV